MKEIIKNALIIAISKNLVKVQDDEDFNCAVEDFQDTITESIKFNLENGYYALLGSCTNWFNDLYDITDFTKSVIFKKMISDIYDLCKEG